MNETYLNYLKVEFCRYYELSPEYIEKVWREAEEPGQDDLSTCIACQCHRGSVYRKATKKPLYKTVALMS